MDDGNHGTDEASSKDEFGHHPSIMHTASRACIPRMLSGICNHLLLESAGSGVNSHYDFTGDEVGAVLDSYG